MKKVFPFSSHNSSTFQISQKIWYNCKLLSQYNSYSAPPKSRNYIIISALKDFLMLHAQKKQKQNSKSSVFQIQNQSIFSSNQNQNKFWPRSNRCKQMVFLPHNLEYLTGWHPQKMFRGSFSWLELSSSSTTFTQRLPTLFGSIQWAGESAF